MVKLNAKKLKASTITEVLISMVIIAIIFGICFMFILKLNTSKSFNNYYLKLYLKAEAIKTEKDNSFFNQEYNYKNYNIIKEVKSDGYSPEIVILNFKAVDEEFKVRAEINHIIILSE